MKQPQHQSPMTAKTLRKRRSKKQVENLYLNSTSYSIGNKIAMIC